MVLFTDINPNWLLFIPPVGIIPAVVGLGSTLLGGLFNRKSQADKDAQKAQTSLARQSAKLAKGRGQRETQLFTQTQSITSQILPRLQALLTGDRSALTQQVAPQLQQLTGAREAAGQRIEESGPSSGAQVQAQLELEKANFAERNRLLASAPKEAQAGLTQLLQLLLGSGASQAAGADQAAATASSTFANIQAGEAKNRFLNLQTLSGITQAAAGFGKSLFKPKTAGSTGTTTIPGSTPGAPDIAPSSMLRNLLGLK